MAGDITSLVKVERKSSCPLWALGLDRPGKASILRGPGCSSGTSRDPGPHPVHSSPARFSKITLLGGRVIGFRFHTHRRAFTDRCGATRRKYIHLLLVRFPGRMCLTLRVRNENDRSVCPRAHREHGQSSWRKVTCPASYSLGTFFALIFKNPSHPFILQRLPSRQNMTLSKLSFSSYEGLAPLIPCTGRGPVR